MNPMPSLSHRQRRSGLRHVLADTLVAADEPERIAELRALIATLETPADRLLARYRGRPDRPLAGPRYSAASW
jgi:hypothetical protein